MATIIKSEMLSASGTALRQVAYDFTDMAAEADDYLVGVRREAMKIVDQARRDGAAVRQDAEAAGRRAAEEAIDRILDEKVAQQMKTLIPALQAAAQQIRDSQQAWIGKWESSAVDLACAIAARLVRGELSRRPEIGATWVREALELATGSAEIVIHLHPTDYPTLERQAAALASAMHPSAKVRLAADNLMSQGGCRVTTEFGTVDLQIEAQLERIKQELN